MWQVNELWVNKSYVLVCIALLWKCLVIGEYDYLREENGRRGSGVGALTLASITMKNQRARIGVRILPGSVDKN